MIQITRATTHTIPDLAPLLTDWVRHQQVPFLLDYGNVSDWLYTMLKDDKVGCYIARDFIPQSPPNNEIVGWILGKLSNYTFTQELFAQEMSWYVSESYKGKGVGGHLMNAFIEWAQEQGAHGVISTILLSASEDSGQSAIKRLNHMGFKEFERTFCRMFKRDE